MTLTAVVVHRDRPESCVLTGKALLSEGVDRLIVVDNGSPDDSLATVRAGLPDAEVLELGANTGFGPGANATSGAANTGSGGGGGDIYDVAAAGGSGVVIIRYTSASPLATGGTITTSGGDQIHTFTSSGTFTVL